MRYFLDLSEFFKINIGSFIRVRVDLKVRYFFLFYKIVCLFFVEVITNFYWVFPLRIFKMNFYIQYRKHNLKNIFVHLKQLHFKTLLPTFIQLKGKSYWLCIVYIPFVSHCVFPGKSIIICHLWRITLFFTSHLRFLF